MKRILRYWWVAGLLLAVAVVLFSGAAAREPVLALAEPVEKGQVISSGDLMVVFVATDDPITTLASEAATGIVGLSAVADGVFLLGGHLGGGHTGLFDKEVGVVPEAVVPAGLIDDSSFDGTGG